MNLKNTTINLGRLEGNVLLFGGVYSNLQALLRIIEVAEINQIPQENIICTGGSIGYCAQPEEVIRTIRKWKIRLIAGHVEMQLRKNTSACTFVSNTPDGFSKQWYSYAQNQLSNDSMEWLKTLPNHLRFNYLNKQCTVVHGSYHDATDLIFKSTSWKVKHSHLDASRSNVIIAGSCGLPFHDTKNEYYWLNPGVIGMPANDGTTRTWYMLLSANSNNEFCFSHCPLEYDYNRTHHLMLAKKLPPKYAQTLVNGIWNDCNTLPEEETTLQGKKINLDLS